MGVRNNLTEIFDSLQKLTTVLSIQYNARPVKVTIDWFHTVKLTLIICKQADQL